MLRAIVIAPARWSVSWSVNWRDRRRAVPRRGPTELLILFQLALGAGFLGMMVWMVLEWAGAL